MAEEGSIRQARFELARTRQRLPDSRVAKKPIVQSKPAAPSPRPIGARRDEDVASPMRDRLMKKGGIQMSRPLATAVAMNAPSRSNPNSDYVEGIGSRNSGELSEDSSNPVFGSDAHNFGTNPSAEEQDQENDVYNPGGASNEGFMEKQRKSAATGQQFLPESTGTPSTEFENKEVNRSSEARSGGSQDFGGGNAGLAAAFMMQQAAAQQGKEEKEDDESLSIQNLIQQSEDVRRMISQGVDAFNATMSIATAETVIGGILELAALLFNMNMRILARKMRSNGLFRKIFPAAKYPFEVTAIISIDFLASMFIFASLCLLIGMMFISFAAMAMPELLIYAAVS